ncbi:MAG: acylphosphatase [Thermoplasmata archaeon]|nr:acylphosphatase [Thermoplasmata archaeon]
MAIRTLLIVSGNVQGVGYRTLVKQIANRMRVTGIVKNLPNGDVEIYCQCSDKETFDKFLKQLKIKATTDDVFAVNVDDIKKYEDDHLNYGEPHTNFETFEIDYEKELDQFQKESLERSEIGILILGGTRSDIQNMSSKQDTMNEKLDKIAEASIKSHEKLDNVSGKLDSIDGRLGDALERYDVFGQKMISIETEMKEFTKQITRLVDHLVESKKEGN